MPSTMPTLRPLEITAAATPACSFGMLATATVEIGAFSTA